MALSFWRISTLADGESSVIVNPIPSEKKFGHKLMQSVWFNVHSKLSLPPVALSDYPPPFWFGRNLKSVLLAINHGLPVHLFVVGYGG